MPANLTASCHRACHSQPWELTNTIQSPAATFRQRLSTVLSAARNIQNRFISGTASEITAERSRNNLDMGRKNVSDNGNRPDEYSIAHSMSDIIRENGCWDEDAIDCIPSLLMQMVAAKESSLPSSLQGKSLIIFDENNQPYMHFSPNAPISSKLHQKIDIDCRNINELENTILIKCVEDHYTALHPVSSQSKKNSQVSFKETQIPADGNCLFRALLQAASGNLENNVSDREVQALRDCIAEFTLQCPNLAAEIWNAFEKDPYYGRSFDDVVLEETKRIGDLSLVERVRLPTWSPVPARPWLEASLQLLLPLLNTISSNWQQLDQSGSLFDQLFMLLRPDAPPPGRDNFAGRSDALITFCIEQIEEEGRDATALRDLLKKSRALRVGESKGALHIVNQHDLSEQNQALLGLLKQIPPLLDDLRKTSQVIPPAQHNVNHSGQQGTTLGSHSMSEQSPFIKGLVGVSNVLDDLLSVPGRWLSRLFAAEAMPLDPSASHFATIDQAIITLLQQDDAFKKYLPAIVTPDVNLLLATTIKYLEEMGDKGSANLANIIVDNKEWDSTTREKRDKEIEKWMIRHAYHHDNASSLFKQALQQLFSQNRARYTQQDLIDTLHSMARETLNTGVPLFKPGAILATTFPILNSPAFNSQPLDDSWWLANQGMIARRSQNTHRYFEQYTPSIDLILQGIRHVKTYGENKKHRQYASLHQIKRMTTTSGDASQLEHALDAAELLIEEQNRRGIPQAQQRIALQSLLNTWGVVDPTPQLPKCIPRSSHSLELRQTANVTSSFSVNEKDPGNIISHVISPLSQDGFPTQRDFINRAGNKLQFPLSRVRAHFATTLPSLQLSSLDDMLLDNLWALANLGIAAYHAKGLNCIELDGMSRAHLINEGLKVFADPARNGALIERQLAPIYQITRLLSQSSTGEAYYPGDYRQLIDSLWSERRAITGLARLGKTPQDLVVVYQLEQPKDLVANITINLDNDKKISRSLGFGERYHPDARQEPYTILADRTALVNKIMFYLRRRSGYAVMSRIIQEATLPVTEQVVDPNAHGLNRAVAEKLLYQHTFKEESAAAVMFKVARLIAEYEAFYQPPRIETQGGLLIWLNKLLATSLDEDRLEFSVRELFAPAIPTLLFPELDDMPLNALWGLYQLGAMALCTHEAYLQDACPVSLEKLWDVSAAIIKSEDLQSKLKEEVLQALKFILILEESRHPTGKPITLQSVAILIDKAKSQLERNHIAQGTMERKYAQYREHLNIKGKHFKDAMLNWETRPQMASRILKDANCDNEVNRFDYLNSGIVRISCSLPNLNKQFDDQNLQCANHKQALDRVISKLQIDKYFQENPQEADFLRAASCVVARGAVEWRNRDRSNFKKRLLSPLPSEVRIIEARHPNLGVREYIYIIPGDTHTGDFYRLSDFPDERTEQLRNMLSVDHSTLSRELRDLDGYNTLSLADKQPLERGPRSLFVDELSGAIAQSYRSDFISGLHAAGYQATFVEKSITVLAGIVKSIVPLWECIESAKAGDIGNAILSCTLDALSLIPVAGSGAKMTAAAMKATRATFKASKVALSTGPAITGLLKSAARNFAREAGEQITKQGVRQHAQQFSRELIGAFDPGIESIVTLGRGTRKVLNALGARSLNSQAALRLIKNSDLLSEGTKPFLAMQQGTRIGDMPNLDRLGSDLNWITTLNSLKAVDVSGRNLKSADHIWPDLYQQVGSDTPRYMLKYDDKYYMVTSSSLAKYEATEHSYLVLRSADPNARQNVRVYRTADEVNAHYKDMDIPDEMAVLTCVISRSKRGANSSRSGCGPRPVSIPRVRYGDPLALQDGPFFTHARYSELTTQVVIGKEYLTGFGEYNKMGYGPDFASLGARAVKIETSNSFRYFVSKENDETVLNVLGYGSPDGFQFSADTRGFKQESPFHFMDAMLPVLLKGDVKTIRLLKESGNIDGFAYQLSDEHLKLMGKSVQIESPLWPAKSIFLPGGSEKSAIVFSVKEGAQGASLTPSEVQQYLHDLSFLPAQVEKKNLKVKNPKQPGIYKDKKQNKMYFMLGDEPYEIIKTPHENVFELNNQAAGAVSSEHSASLYLYLGDSYQAFDRPNAMDLVSTPGGYTLFSHPEPLQSPIKALASTGVDRLLRTNMKNSGFWMKRILKEDLQLPGKVEIVKDVIPGFDLTRIPPAGGQPRTDTLMVSAHGGYERYTGDAMLPDGIELFFFAHHDEYLMVDRFRQDTMGKDKVWRSSLDIMLNGLHGEFPSAISVQPKKSYQDALARTGTELPGHVKDYTLSFYEHDSYVERVVALANNRLSKKKAMDVLTPNGLSHRLSEVLSGLEPGGRLRELGYHKIAFAICRGRSSWGTMSRIGEVDLTFRRQPPFNEMRRRRDISRQATPAETQPLFHFDQVFEFHQVTVSVSASGEKNVTSELVDVLFCRGEGSETRCYDGPDHPPVLLTEIFPGGLTAMDHPPKLLTEIFPGGLTEMAVATTPASA